MSVLVLPDSQNGFRAGRTLHDRRAWNAALAVLDRVEVERIVLLGDMVDFSTLNKKFRKPGDLYGAMGKTLEETEAWLGALAAYELPIVYIMGNHEERLRNTLIDTNPDLEAIASVEGLLNFEEHGIRAVGPYGQDYVHRGVIYTHGHKYAKRGGQTAAKYLADETRNVVFGHCHKRELASETYRGVERFALSPGTLARIDGTVPGSSLSPNWQQGLALIHHADGRTWPEMLPIEHGKLYFRGGVVRCKGDRP